MQDTCKKLDCHLWKKYKDTCPNYTKSEWREETSNEIKLIHDCAPIRTMLMLQELYNRLIGVEKSNEQVRNAVFGVREAITMRKAELIDYEP